MIDNDDKPKGSKVKFPSVAASYRPPETKKAEDAEKPAQRRVRLLGLLARRGQ